MDGHCNTRLLSCAWRRPGESRPNYPGAVAVGLSRCGCASCARDLPTRPGVYSENGQRVAPRGRRKRSNSSPQRVNPQGKVLPRVVRCRCWQGEHYSLSRLLFHMLATWLVLMPKQSATPAAQLAERIVRAARTAQSEEDLKIAVEGALKKALTALGIQHSPEYEITILNGSADAVYGHVIIEYQKRGKLAKDAGRTETIEQVTRYLLGTAGARRLNGWPANTPTAGRICWGWTSGRPRSTAKGRIILHRESDQFFHPRVIRCPR
jgi:hypothetical protein